MSQDYLTGYLPDSTSRLRHERKKALRNVLIMAVVIGAFFYVLTKAIRILVEDSRVVHYPVSVNTDTNSDKVSPDEIIYYGTASKDQAKIKLELNELDKEIANTHQEIVKTTEQEANEETSNQQLSSQPLPTQENSNQKVVKQAPTSEPNQSKVKSTNSIETVKQTEKNSQSMDTVNTDNANAQDPIDLKDLEAIYNKQLSTILDDN